jgi:MFS family permease
MISLKIENLDQINLIFSLFLIDRFGRRNLHLFSLSGIGLVTIILGVLLGALSTNAEASVFASIFILVFIAFFGCGAGPIPWFLAGTYHKAIIFNDFQYFCGRRNFPLSFNLVSFALKNV